MAVQDYQRWKDLSSRIESRVVPPKNIAEIRYQLDQIIRPNTRKVLTGVPYQTRGLPIEAEAPGLARKAVDLATPPHLKELANTVLDEVPKHLPDMSGARKLVQDAVGEYITKFRENQEAEMKRKAELKASGGTPYVAR
jgi:hypothetical protein